ncbi:DedA family protein [Alicyclobacillus sp. SO9]|uniref:DedA family protein n=1 Tax=Alicyclobacillus sp. SO9 TaxID=2665646 RepID=UPI0018E85748|nr:DedA family protein [Alicyclobacillus sp. SO9]QQE78610.1 DedA family protein [Alicyclobacillus sp. SO9]
MRRGRFEMLDWFGHLAESVLAIGYPGILIALVVEGLGLPFPGDAVMAFYGIAAAKGNFPFLGVLIVSIIGYMIGAIAAFYLSRQFGSRLLDRIAQMPLLNQRSMRRTTDLMDRYGPLLLIPGRFLPGVRSVSSYVAGALNMDLQPFLVYTGVGVSLWCAAWVAVGYWFGENLDTVLHFAQHSLAYLTGAGLLAVFVVWLWKRQRSQAQ